MRQVSFEVDDADLDAVLDGVLPLLPFGARQTEGGPGRTRLVAIGHARRMPGRAELEAAAGRPLDGYAEEEVPVDWRLRRPLGGRLIGGRVALRQSVDAAPAEGIVDVVIDWSGSGFGSGSHPTTRMCVELLLGVEPEGALVDIGCGLGTLAILAAKLGFAPVLGVERDAEALEQARRNVTVNGVDVELRELDVERDPVPVAPVLAVNAPPAVHARVADALAPDVRAVVASGFSAAETPAVIDRYAAAGLVPVERRDDGDGVWVALRLEP